jgi:hypothetical protein
MIRMNGVRTGAGDRVDGGSSARDRRRMDFRGRPLGHDSGATARGHHQQRRDVPSARV